MGPPGHLAGNGCSGFPRDPGAAQAGPALLILPSGGGSVGTPVADADQAGLHELKAAEQLLAIGSAYVFDLDVRDYNLWRLVTAPVILILFDASPRRGNELFGCTSNATSRKMNVADRRKGQRPYAFGSRSDRYSIGKR